MRDSHGAIERFEASLVVRGFEKRQGLDYSERFVPVVWMDSIKTILALIAIRNWNYYQFDVSISFLKGIVQEEIFIEPPHGVQVSSGSCLELNKALYGLKIR